MTNAESDFDTVLYDLRERAYGKVLRSYLLAARSAEQATASRKLVRQHRQQRPHRHLRLVRPKLAAP